MCYLANTTCAIINIMTTLIFIILIVSRSHAFLLVIPIRSSLHVLVAVAVISYFQQMLSRPSTIVFIDCDNYSLVRSSLESYGDSEFLTHSDSVCWRSLGGSAFPKKLSPQQIPVSIDLEDSIIGGGEMVLATSQFSVLPCLLLLPTPRRP